MVSVHTASPNPWLPSQGNLNTILPSAKAQRLVSSSSSMQSQKQMQQQEKNHHHLPRGECLKSQPRNISCSSVVTDDSHESDTRLAKASTSSEALGLSSTKLKAIATIDNPNDKSLHNSDMKAPTTSGTTTNACSRTAGNTNRPQNTCNNRQFPLTTHQSPEDHVHDSKIMTNINGHHNIVSKNITTTETYHNQFKSCAQNMDHLNPMLLMGMKNPMGSYPYVNGSRQNSNDYQNHHQLQQHNNSSSASYFSANASPYFHNDFSKAVLIPNTCSSSNENSPAVPISNSTAAYDTNDNTSPSSNNDVNKFVPEDGTRSDSTVKTETHLPSLYYTNGSNGSISSNRNLESSSLNDASNNQCNQVQQQQQTQQMLNSNKGMNEMQTNNKDLNTAMHSLMMFEAEIAKQFQKCQRMQREVEVEKKKYLQDVETARQRRFQLAYQITNGAETISNDFCGSVLGLKRSQLQQQQFQLKFNQNFAENTGPVPKSNSISTTASTSSFNQTPSPLDALALACAAEKSLISQNTTDTTNTNDDEDQNMAQGSPRSIVLDNSDNDKSGSDGGSSLLKKRKLRHEVACGAIESSNKSPSFMNLHRYQHENFDQNDLKLPYRAKNTKAKKNKTKLKAKQNSLTQSRRKSNGNLQLPTPELEFNVYGNKMGDRSNFEEIPAPTPNQVPRDSDIPMDFLGVSNNMPKPPQSNSSSSSSLLSELVAPMDECDEDLVSKQFSNGNWSSNVTINDVLCGRGGLTNNHPGNVFFRGLVRSRQEAYLFASKREKALVAHGIVDVIRSLKPPGRFLKKDKKDMWTEIGNKKAREKTSQALREKAPELMEMLQKDLENHGTLKHMVNKTGKKNKCVKRVTGKGRPGTPIPAMYE